jgi:hypothetical protein
MMNIGKTAHGKKDYFKSSYKTVSNETAIIVATAF